MDCGLTDMVEELVSIIVPVYNAESFIENTIAYVQAQTYEKWELILVDDCSNDNSVNIIKDKAAFDKRIRLIKLEENIRAAKARNRGIKEAQGRYICFLDADDIWESDKLCAELEFMKKNGAGFAFTAYEFADENGNGLGKVVHVPDRLTYSQAVKNTTIFTSTVMIDRKIIPDKDIYMPNIASEDTATWWNILRTGRVAYGLDKNMVKYRRSANTLSANKMTAIKRIWNLYRKHEHFNVFKSFYCMVFWAFRAVFRRI
jgi:teichuronic acid biosynthesis glycosyltransferase TuaG